MATSRYLAGWSPTHQLRGIVVVALLLLALAPDAAWAHDLDVRHQVIVQVGADKTEMVVLYEVPAGASSQLLRGMWDANADGVLDDAEQKALAMHLGDVAMTGVTLSRDTVNLSLSGGDWRLEVQPESDGSIVLALLLELAGGAGAYALALSPTLDGTNPPRITVEVEAGEGFRLGSATGAVDADGIGAGPFSLSPNDAIEWTVEDD